jgi:RimJ/RimL family protein N-acetyltransferase
MSLESIKNKENFQPVELSTAMPNVLVREFRPEDVEEFRQVAWKNRDPLTTALLPAGGLGDMAEETAEGNQPTGTHRMAIWLDGKIIGGINMGPDDEDNTVDISYFIDKDHGKKGIASVAVGAVLDWQASEGKTAVAHVKSSNFSSLKLLKRLGFAHKKSNWVEHEEIYTREPGAPKAKDKDF